MFAGNGLARCAGQTSSTHHVEDRSSPATVFDSVGVLQKLKEIQSGKYPTLPGS
jgi:hypothetical protein